MTRSPFTPATFTPAVFTAVMGTGILATATHGLPHSFQGAGAIATFTWLLDLALLAAMLALAVVHYARDRSALRRHLLDPASAPFLGAVAMGILSAGTATLVVGAEHLGTQTAATIDLTLWWLGSAIGLASATVVPFLAFTRHAVQPDAATPVWLLPIVAPMVSAASGALLIDNVSAHAGTVLALACYAQFGATLIAAFAVIASVWNRLAHHQHRVPATVPSLFIVLGPLGQSVTTAGLLADHAPESLGLSRSAMTAFAVLFGVPTMGFAMLWLVIALAMLTDAARKGLPFTMGWWAFTFPIGTTVTGTAGLALHTGVAEVGWLSVGLYCLLVAGWIAAATGTARLALSGAGALQPRGEERPLVDQGGVDLDQVGSRGHHAGNVGA